MSINESGEFVRESDAPEPDSVEGQQTWETLGEIAETRNSPYLNEYIKGSAETYQSHGVDFSDIEVSPDHSNGRLEFTAAEDLQANPGILHGGVSFFYADTLTAAMVMARHPEHQPLTTKSSIQFLRPCIVGSKYIVEANFSFSREENFGKKILTVEDYNFTIKDAATGKETLKGVVTYYPKPVDGQ